MANSKKITDHRKINKPGLLIALACAIIGLGINIFGLYTYSVNFSMFYVIVRSIGTFFCVLFILYCGLLYRSKWVNYLKHIMLLFALTYSIIVALVIAISGEHKDAMYLSVACIILIALVLLAYLAGRLHKLRVVKELTCVINVLVLTYTILMLYTFLKGYQLASNYIAISDYLCCFSPLFLFMSLNGAYYATCDYAAGVLLDL